MERELDYWAPGAAAPSKIVVRIGTPMQDGESWSCFLTIEGLPEPYSAHVFHSDGIGAMLTAAAIAPSVVRSALPGGGRVTWLGSEDLGLPVPPSQSWLLRAPNDDQPRTLNVKLYPPERAAESWSVLLVARDCGRMGETGNKTREIIERRVHGPTWAKTLELGAAAVVSLVRELADRSGGGVLTEVREAPPWCMHSSE